MMVCMHLSQGDVAGFADNLLTVPVPVFKGIQSLLTGDVPAVAKHTPVVGRMVDAHLLGGKEKYNKRERKKRRRR